MQLFLILILCLVSLSSQSETTVISGDFLNDLRRTPVVGGGFSLTTVDWQVLVWKNNKWLVLRLLICKWILAENSEFIALLKNHYQELQQQYFMALNCQLKFNRQISRQKDWKQIKFRNHRAKLGSVARASYCFG